MNNKRSEICFIRNMFDEVKCSVEISYLLFDRIDTLVLS